MDAKRKKTSISVLAVLNSMFFFYAIGRFAYSYIFNFAVDSIEFLTTHRINFYGKIRYIFVGDPMFGLIFSSIPLVIWICYFTVNMKGILSLITTTSVFIFFTGLFYFLFCYLDGNQLIPKEVLVKKYAGLKISVNDLPLNEIYLKTIALGFLFTYLSLRLGIKLRS